MSNVRSPFQTPRVQKPTPSGRRLSLSQRRLIAVLLGFFAFVTVSLVLAYGLSRFPSPQHACTKQCSASGRSGTLVYSGPATSKDFYREANSTCSCQ